jgi:hypothetical protein
MHAVEYSAGSESADLVLKICVGVLAVCLAIAAHFFQRGHRWKIFARTTSEKGSVIISTMIQEAGRSGDAADLERFLDHIGQPFPRPISEELARIYTPAAHSEMRYSKRYIATKTVFVVEQVSLLAMEALRNLPTFKGTKFLWPSPFRCAEVDVEPESGLLKLLGDLYDFRAMISAVIRSKREPGPGLTREEELVVESFTPAGTRTTFAMSMDDEEFVEYVKQLEAHPLEEVRQISAALISAYKHRYPNLLHSHSALKPGTIEPLQRLIPGVVTPDLRSDLLPLFQGIATQTVSFHPSLDIFFPRVDYRLPLDYASILELQTLIKLDMKGDFLSPFSKFDKWYLERLPAELRKKADSLIERVFDLIDKGDVDIWKAQYFVPVGFKRRLCFSATYSQLRKLFGLIGDETVSPLLRKRLEKLRIELDGFYPKVFPDVLSKPTISRVLEPSPSNPEENRVEVEEPEGKLIQTGDGLRQRSINN